MGRMQTKLMALALMAMTDSVKGFGATTLEPKRYDTSPMQHPAISRSAEDKAEAKRARKAQIKRNGGKR